MNLILALAVGWLIGDRMEARRQFRRLERFVLMGSMQSWKPKKRNTRTPVWGRGFSADTSYETNKEMSYRSMLKEEEYQV
jgi:hypothetical protein